MSTFTNYGIEVDCLITWFPVRDSADLKTPRIRSAKFVHHADDFLPNTGVITTHGQGGGGFEDELTSQHVFGQTDFSVDADQVFLLALYLQIGRKRKTRRMAVPSNAITPFLLIVRSSDEDNREIAGTAVALQGVITAGRRRSKFLSAVLRFFP